MKRRYLLALLALIGISATAAYVITQTTVNVTVNEGITISPPSFDVSLYPKESVTKTFTASNAGPVAIDATFTYTVNGPVPGDLTVTMSPSGSVTIPAGGSADVDVTITASQSITPGAYTVTIEWNR